MFLETKKLFSKKYNYDKNFVLKYIIYETCKIKKLN